LGKQIVYCQVCGERILESDLEAGRALSVAGHNFCGKCRDQAPADLIPQDLPEPARRSPSTPRTDHRGTDRARNAASYAPAPSAKSSAGMIVGVVVAIAAAAILIVMLMSGKKEPEGSHGGGGSVTPPASTNKPPDTVAGDPQKAAREIYDKMREFAAANASNHDAVIARVKQDLPKLAGTIFETDARMLLRERERGLDETRFVKTVEELEKKVLETEKTDPLYTARPRVQGWIRDARATCADFNTLTAKIDALARGYDLRFDAAAVEQATKVLNKARQLQADRKFDDALAALDAWPGSFDGTNSAELIKSCRDEINAAKRGAENDATTVNVYNAAVNRLNGNLESQEAWEQSVKDFKKTLEDLKDTAKLQKQGVDANTYRNMMIGSNFMLALYYSRWKNEMEPMLKHLEEAFKAGFGSFDELDKEPQKRLLENARKDPRYAKLVDRWKNRKLIGVQGQPLTEEQCAQAKLAAGEGGLSIVKVMDPGVALKGGVEQGDFLLAFNGKKLGRAEPFNDLRVALEGVVAGKDYEVEVFRGGARKKLKVRWDK